MSENHPINQYLLVRDLTLPRVGFLESILAKLVCEARFNHLLFFFERGVRLTVKQCLLYLLAIGHDEWTILEDCLIKRLSSDL